MARQKRGSTVLETARQRLSGLKSITPAPDFGPNLKLTEYEQDINDFNDSLNNYNEKLALIDQLQNELIEQEKRLNEKNKRMLSAAEAQYGSDSSEYEQAGGKRQSERKRPAKKTPGKG